MDDIMNLQTLADELLGLIPGKRLRFYDFEYLDRESTVRDLWQFVAPGLLWSHERWALLDKMRINIIPQKAYTKNECVLA